MSKENIDYRKDLEKFATQEPHLTILSDESLVQEEIYKDRFNLRYHLGPVYDILRHPKTITPLTIAIYGDWGVGKTSAMRWLQRLLEIWNKQGVVEDPNDKIKLRSVWFYPWKYHTKEDVWRGLIAEVIIDSIKASEVTIGKVKKAGKQFGIFLGLSFMHALAGLKLKAKIPGGAAEAELDFSKIEEILIEYKEAVHPEKGYLNDFEDSFRSWVQETIGKQERIVLFIDDLDRCMPEVALQVLEALKLYLNIEGLVFVIGVDRIVIDQLAKGHYEKLGLDRKKGEQYLAKMFQIEVNLGPGEKHIEEFLEHQLSTMKHWQDKLNEMERNILKEEILSLAGRNPREVKRLINSALMSGVGALTQESGINFCQGVQVFFVRKILHERYSMGWLVGERLGDDFFGEWSRTVSGKMDISPTVAVPEDFPEKLREYYESSYSPEMESENEEIPLSKDSALDLGFALSDFHEILANQKYVDLLKLLSDVDLGRLMRIRYPHETIALGEVLGITIPNFIDETIARAVNKKAEDVVEEDFSRVQRIELAGLPVSTLEPFRKLRNLKVLNISDSQIFDLKPLRELQSLELLNIAGTKVSDLAPLRKLKNLRRLHIGRTQIVDISPLEELTNLAVIGMLGTGVSDIEPLRNLKNLVHLTLQESQVSDLEPLSELKNLGVLNIVGSKVSDLASIKNLISLEQLYAGKTQIVDISPLSSLKNLATLGMVHTQVSDMTPLSELKSLRVLNLGGTKVSDLQPLKNLTNLVRLHFDRTSVATIDPLKDLVNLEVLGFPKTVVSDLTPLGHLKNLNVLNIVGTKVSDLQPLKNLTNLVRLHFDRTSVATIDPLKDLVNLEVLGFPKTVVSDLTPLGHLKNLNVLNIVGTKVSDLQPLKNLTNLVRLHFDRTSVATIDPLKDLINLNILELSWTKVSDLALLSELKNLRMLNIVGTKVSDLQPLKNLTNLNELYVASTKVDPDQVKSLQAALLNLIISTD